VCFHVDPKNMYLYVPPVQLCLVAYIDCPRCIFSASFHLFLSCIYFLRQGHIFPPLFSHICFCGSGSPVLYTNIGTRFLPFLWMLQMRCRCTRERAVGKAPAHCLRAHTPPVLDHRSDLNSGSSDEERQPLQRACPAHQTAQEA